METFRLRLQRFFILTRPCPIQKHRLPSGRRENEEKTINHAKAYVKAPGKGRASYPFSKHFPDDEEDEKGRGKVAGRGRGVACGASFGIWWIIASSLGHIATRGAKRCANKLFVGATFWLIATITIRKCTTSWPAHFTESQKKTKCRWITYTETNRTTGQVN